MMKYIVYCDFSTLKCNFKQFAEFLHGYTENFENINNNIWLVDIDDSTTPFFNDLSELPKDLEGAGYADKDSVIFSAQYSDLAYRFAGIDKSFHIN